METSRCKNVAKVLNGISVKIAFVRMCIKTMLSNTLENFFDMFLMVGDAVRIDENVIKVDSHTHVKHIAKDIIHEALEGSRYIR